MVNSVTFHKGQSGNPNGRPPGEANKATRLAREAIAAFVDGNAERLTGWLDSIAATNPKDAFNCFMSVVEYHIPKLARSELTGKDGDPIDVKMANHYKPEDIHAIFQRWQEQQKSTKGDTA